jgi:hypothetical protein
MKRSILTAALLILAPALRAQAPAASEVQRLAWLEGRWSGSKDGVTIEEHWTSPSGDALLGMNKTVKGGRMVSFESLRIAATPDGIAYLASPQGVPPTAFKLVELADKRIVFENKQHDFPQRILYWLDESGALHARIEGPRGGKTVSQEWIWTKTR